MKKFEFNGFNKSKSNIKEFSPSGFAKNNWRKISQIALVVLCICLIIYFMPKGNSLQYSFRTDAPWTHQELRAEFSFDIYKGNDRIAAEKDSIRKYTPPVFRQLGASNEFYAAAITTSFIGDVDIEARRPFFNKLKTLLERGIIQDSDTAYLPIRGKQAVTIYSDGANRRTTIEKEFITLSKAFDELRSEIPQESEDSFDIADFIKPNYTCDTKATDAGLQAKFNAIDTVYKHIEEGKTIIDRGDIVDKETAEAIKTYIELKNKKEETLAEGNWLYILLGQALFIIVCMFILLAYLFQYKHEIINNYNKFIFTIISVALFPTLVGILTSSAGISVFVLPFAILPITLCLFIDSDTAFVANMISIIMCSVMVEAPYEFLLLQVLAGCSAILSLRDLSSRSQMFKCVLITFLTYAITYLCYEFLVSSGFSNMSHRMYIYFVVSTILTLFIYPLMFLIEKTFGFISSVTLIELSNLNSKLLQRMSQEAPGTFQHSMQVGNLAAEAALAIGANSLEVRTGAMYHDIGKLENPIFFTENQNGSISPHSTLSPIESAQTIIKHVTDGLALAEHEKLPKKIKEFIATHHGTSKVGYFYITYKNEHPDENVDESLFTYPGPKPTTKEQAVLMMADCVEAASHSLKEYSEESINGLVDKIIDARFQDGELSMSPLTFQDIYTIKEVFKKRLMAIYHTRISYPTEKEK